MTFEDEFDHAEDLRAAGNRPAAFDAHRALYERYVRQQPDDPSDVPAQKLRRTVLEGYSVASEELGRYEEAADAVGGLLAIWRRFNNRFAFDYTAVRLSRLLNALGRTAEAEEILGRLNCDPGALEFPADGGRPDFAAWEGRFRWTGVAPSKADLVILPALRELGRIEALRGCYGKAVALLERAIRRCAADDPLRPELIGELAGTLHESGDFPGARRELARLPGHADVTVRVRAHEIEAWVDWLEGLPRRAVRNLVAAAQLLVHDGMVEPAVWEWLNVAAVLIASNSLVRAGHALDIVEQATSNPEARAQAAGLRELGRRRGESKGARAPQSVTELWGRAKTGEAGASRPPSAALPALQANSFLGRFEAACLTLYALWGDDDFEGAARRHEELQGEFGHTDSRIVQAQLRCLGGLVAYHGGDLARAVEQLEEAAAALRAAHVYFYEWQCLRYLSWAQAKRGESTAADESRQRSEGIMERIADTLSPVDRAIYLLNKWTEEEAHLSAELRQAGGTGRDGLARLLPPLARWNSLRRIDAAMQYIDDHRRVAAGKAQRLAPDFATLGVLRRTFSKPVLRFVVLPDEVRIIFVHQWSPRTLSSSLNRVGIRALVRVFHENVEGARRGDERAAAKAEDALRELSRALRLSEVLAGLPEGTAVRVLPDDCLHGVPFAALPLEDGTLLMDRFAISIGSEWRARRRPAADSGRGLVLLAALGYEDRRGLELPGAAVEADAVEAVLKPRFTVDRPIEDDITAQLLRSRIPDCSHVHLVAHGVFEPENPAASGLRIPAAGRRFDVLSIADFAEMDLSRVEHIALSSCWGADDYVSPGRIIVSLPETLLQSGAATVLACLWPLDDGVAPRLMRSYYAALESCSPGAALRAAQQAVRSAPETSSWYFWAGLRVYAEA